MQAPGPIGDVALKSAVGLSELYQRALEQYDVRNTEALIPFTNKDAVAVQQASQQQAASAGGQPGQPGANPGANGYDPLQALLGSLGGAV